MYTNLPNRVDDLSCLFAEFGQLAKKFDAVDLGLGTPELDPPKFLKDRLIEAVDLAPQQYIDPRGYAPLREAIAKHYSPLYSNLDRDLNPDTEVIATAGAVAGLNCILMSIVSEGDEIVTFEPCWTGILNMIKLTGGVLKTVPMVMNKCTESKTISWDYDWEKFEEALSDRTKAIMLINPHSPTGRVFTNKDLETLTQILDSKAPNAYVISDDVYDFCKFQNEESLFAGYKHNFNRSVTCFNGGKRFA